MKKSTVLILLVIFFGSIIIVGIFGMQAVPFEQRIYVREIVPTSVYCTYKGIDSGIELEIKDDEQGKYVMTTYEEGLTILIMTQVEPENSTVRTLKLSILNNTPENPIAEIGERGEIIFLRCASLHVRYSATDSATGPKLDMWIYVSKPKEK